MRPLVYLASPYTLGSAAKNVRFACLFFAETVAEGVVDLYPPLWSHVQELVAPVGYAAFLTLDFAVIRRCDALLRLAAVGEGENDHYYQWESAGADKEVGFANSLGLPVFLSKSSLYNWATTVYTAPKAPPVPRVLTVPPEVWSTHAFTTEAPQ